MPSSTQFRHGFGLENDLELGKIKLKPPKIEEHPIKEHQTYHFHIHFKIDDDLDDENATEKVLSSLKRKLSGKTTIQSSYGSSYECHFDKKSFKVIDKRIDCLGIAEKVAKSSSSTKRKRNLTDEDKELVQEAKSKGYRVIKSHFNSGVCAVCHKHVEVGEEIVQGPDTSRGGWSHLHCEFDSKKHERSKDNDAEVDAKER
jgi:hypothetical protein